MRLLYLDCAMGAAGDMIASALIELIPDREQFIEEVNQLGIPGVKVQIESSIKCGITGTHLSVRINDEEEESHDVNVHDHSHEHNHSHEHDHNHNVDHSHHNSTLHDIEHLVRGHLQVSKKVQDDIMGVYGLIAEAESHVHGTSVDEIHFHEVGTMDAIADIAMVCLLIERLQVNEIIVSPVHVGSGMVRCMHGILPVPAPATAFILQDVPIYGGNIRGELCTPTGAALLKYFATRFESMPIMKAKAIGYGMGKKDFAAANCVRAFLGETEEKQDSIMELSCNVDDMTGEAIGFALESLLDAGALDVYTIPIGMKKSRPATLISVMCLEKDKDKIIQLIFSYTTTIGIRETKAKRYILDRTSIQINTPYGIVSRKDSSGYGVTRSKYEYNDIARIAKELGVSMEQVKAVILNHMGDLNEGCE